MVLWKLPGTASIGAFGDGDVSCDLSNLYLFPHYGRPPGLIVWRGEILAVSWPFPSQERERHGGRRQQMAGKREAGE